MAQDQSTNLWRVRSEDDGGEGRAVDFPQLAQEIADGAWDEADHVRDPRVGKWVLIGNHPQLEEFLPPTPRLAPKPAEDPEMDVTPMIDVTFQLIIFFMITATFVVQKTMDMPQAQATEEESRRQPSWEDVQQQFIVVDVRGDGTITVDGEAVGLADLESALRHVTDRRQIVEMALKVHDDVPFEIEVKVLDAAGGAEIEQVHLVRGESSSEGPPDGEGA
jgi:biopolymer transport protein ExbD